ncbi:hypothetical protein HanHA300_Chr04g0120701 [Helianthus annuus]|nr:hypothetical protein HanHA300_Chr04g0120701 [Helianthus annuus]KAJ0586974.1 hypothetical protein HanIR_Chr04g0157861 [Helianthus annuus]KAJ0595588.1 hypothetical protein HanHA89_Chr04g0132981 [Helianthus annuus]KAJ0760019.1 hypothetical protein HanOQP8_Chr04g0133091 [Helianthus annuus]
MLYNPLKYNIIYNSNYALHPKKHTRYNMRCIMYYSLKKNTVSLSLGFQISHLIPIRLPLSLSLSAIQKPQALSRRFDSESPSSLSLSRRFRNPKHSYHSTIVRHALGSSTMVAVGGR